MYKHNWLMSLFSLLTKSTSASKGESRNWSSLQNPPLLTSTTLTSPPCPGYTASIRPIFHSRRGVSGSITKTTSPTLRFSLGRNHLWRKPMVGRYSRIQRFHTLQISSCTRLHRLRTLFAVVLTFSGARSPPM